MEKIKDKADNLEINENTLRKYIPVGHQFISMNFIYYSVQFKVLWYIFLSLCLKKFRNWKELINISDDGNVISSLSNMASKWCQLEILQLTFEKLTNAFYPCGFILWQFFPCVHHHILYTSEYSKYSICVNKYTLIPLFFFFVNCFILLICNIYNLILKYPSLK